MSNPAKKSPARLARNILLIVLAAVVCAVLGICLWSDPASFIAMCVIVLTVPVVFFGGLLFLGRFLKRTGRRGGRVVAGIGWAGLALVAALFGYVIWTAGPWFNGVIAFESLPGVGECVLSQAWVDWFDDYDLRLFQRQADGQWLLHCGGYFWQPANRDRIAKIVLDGRDGSPEITLANGDKRYFLREDNPSVYPATLSPADLHARHLAEMRKQRNLLIRLSLCKIAPQLSPFHQKLKTESSKLP